MKFQYVLRIVMSWTSLSCKTDTKERVKALQTEDEGQDDVLNRALDALETQNQIQDLGSGNQTVGEKFEAYDPEKSADMALDALKSLEADKQDVSELMEELETIQERIKDMDVVSRNQNVIGRIDDLEAELKTYFERELCR